MTSSPKRSHLALWYDRRTKENSPNVQLVDVGFVRIWSSCRTNLPLPPPLRNKLGSLLNPYRFDIGELPYSMGSQFPPMPRPLHSPEWDSRIGRHHAVDEHHPRFQIIDESFALILVVCPGACSQAKSAVVRDANRIVQVLRSEHARHRSKQLFLVSRRAFWNICQHGRRIKIPRAIQRFASRQDFRTCLDRLLHVAVQVSQSIGCRERPEFRLFVEWIADLQCCHFLREELFELLRDRFGHNKSFRRDARLAIIENPGFYRRCRRHFQVCARHHNKWIASAQFQHHFLDSLRCADAYFNSRSLASCQRGSHYPRIAQHAIHFVRADQQRLKASRWKAGSSKQVFNQQR